MAIRIDLLPRYVGLRRWFKRLLLACLGLVGAFAAILFVLYYREQLRLQTLKENRDAYQKFATMADEAQAEAKKKEEEAKPYQDTVNFFVDAGRTGPERAALLDTIHRYIYNGAVISLLDLSDGQTIKFKAMVKTPDEYANFLNNLRRGTSPAGIVFADLPSGAGIVGYSNNVKAEGAQQNPQPAGQQEGATPGLSVTYQVFPNNIDASAKLLNPVVIPTPPGEAAAAPAGGPGGPGGPPAPPAP